jgi:putative DNA primase/helicase
MTLVSPNIQPMMMGYEQYCPRFFSLLRNIANGRDWVMPALQCWFGYCLTGEIRHHGILFIQGPPGIGKTQILQVLFELLHSYAKLLTDMFLSKNGGESKRFDMQDIVGKRMLFKDETMMGMSWDEARMSDIASGRKLAAEIKFGRGIDFHNTGKICVSGNHRPHFVGGEAGGLTSRMLLLEAQGKSIRGASEEIVYIASEIVAEEGPSILMWALEACIADYAQGGQETYRRLMHPMIEAAKGYTRENSLFRQWVEAKMCIHPDADMDTLEAHAQFTKYAKDRDDRTHARMKLSDFTNRG